jgi:hypothetical protein
MNDIEKAMKEAHKFADTAISNSRRESLGLNLSSAVTNLKTYLSHPVVVSKLYIITMCSISTIMLVLGMIYYG